MSIPQPIIDHLANNGIEVDWRVGNHVPALLQRWPGLIVVKEGELVRVRETRDPKLPHAPRRIERLECVRAEQVAGGLALIRGEPAGAHHTPRVPSRLVVVPEWQLLSVLAGVPNGLIWLSSYKARLRAQVADAAAAAALLGASNGRPRELVLLEGDWSDPAVAGLVQALAAEFAAAYNEPTAYLHLDDGALPPGAFGGQGVTATLGGPTPADALTAMINAFPQLAANMNGVPARCLVVAPRSVDVSLVAEAVDRVVYLHRGSTVAWPRHQPVDTPFAWVGLIDPATGMHDPGETPFPPGTTRVHLPSNYPLLPPQLQSIARAVSDRRVGIALGGGGGLAYSHLAVLLELEAHGVPIDLASGVSFGTVVACYWARYGKSAATQMIGDRLTLQISALAHMVAGVFAQRIMNSVLDSPQVEAIERAVFPMAADIVMTSLDPMMRGTAGECIRASGGFAPIFPATPGGKRSHVDGGLIANVPTHVLQLEGARAVIASDAVAPTGGPHLTPDLDAMGLPQWLRDTLDVGLDLVDPRRRWLAGFFGAQTLFNAVGELSSARAAAHFEAETVATVPYWLMNPWAVMNATRSDHGFQHAVAVARDMWAALEAPV